MGVVQDFATAVGAFEDKIEKTKKAFKERGKDIQRSRLNKKTKEFWKKEISPLVYEKEMEDEERIANEIKEFIEKNTEAAGLEAKAVEEIIFFAALKVDMAKIEDLDNDILKGDLRRDMSFNMYYPAKNPHEIDEPYIQVMNRELQGANSTEGATFYLKESSIKKVRDKTRVLEEGFEFLYNLAKKLESPPEAVNALKYPARLMEQRARMMEETLELLEAGRAQEASEKWKELMEMVRKEEELMNSLIY